MREETTTPEVIIEKTLVHQKKPAPKGSIYFVARCRRPDKVHSIWFLAKKSLLFKEEEAELKKHLTDQLLETVEEAERKAAFSKGPRPVYLSDVVKYIKRIWRNLRR